MSALVRELRGLSCGREKKDSLVKLTRLSCRMRYMIDHPDCTTVAVIPGAGLKKMARLVEAGLLEEIEPILPVIGSGASPIWAHHYA